MADSSDSRAVELLGRLWARPRPSAMLVLAHPDDEAVGAASLLPTFVLASFVYATDGAPRDPADALAAGCSTREEYASRRRGELMSALESVGVAPHRVELVGCVDQEAWLQLAALARWLEILMREHQPAVVLTHPYEGGHPDHDSVAFAVHAARDRIALAGDEPPVVAEFTSYHRGADGGWQFGEFLPAADHPIVTRSLTPSERTLKRRLLGCYASQREVLQQARLDVERFRVAPDYDFTQPPSASGVLYEEFGWGVSAAQWRERARFARERLELPVSAAFRHPAEPVAHTSWA